jgi:extracellular factor (EF) 3-hydroxypalmitic acid methyl ester biosynthesis protein
MSPAKLAAATPLTRTYEELDGAQGREVFFRPHRYRAQDLSPLKCTVVVRADELPVECPLYDVSQNGVAFEWPSAPNFVVDDSLADIEVRFDEHVAFRGAARVGSVRDQDGVTVVGVSFGELLLDVEEIQQLRAIKGWSGRDGQGLTFERKIWRVPGYDKFKSQVAELSLYLEDSERKMSELESELAWNTVQGEADSAAKKALIKRVHQDFATEVVRASEEIDAVRRTVPPAHDKVLKQYSLRMVDEYFIQAPCTQRARFKPFGYPGDYEVMRFYYERNFEGPTLFAKAIGYATIQTKAAQAVRYRKDLIKRQLQNLSATRCGLDRPLRILSVAAGPAQELVDLFREMEDLPCKLDIVLFDQDKAALSYAYRRLKPLVEQKFPGKVQILYLHESIKRLLRDSEMFATFGKFDCIFSCGLYDYLQPTTATVLTRNLFARLAPAGELYVGNMEPNNPSRWIMEHHLDWHLLYRTRGELLEIGARAAPDAAITVLEEETGVNPFIQLAKR